jgi:hypothetical protein
MWAQLIKVRLKPGKDLAVAAAQLRAAEQPGSGLVREMFMRDQKDSGQAYILAVFESEERHVRASRTRAARKDCKPCRRRWQCRTRRPCRGA